MRLIRFETGSGEHTGAVIPGDRVLDLGPVPLLDVVIGADPDDRIRAALADDATLPTLGDLRLCPPVRPGKILCLGYNYRGHVPAGADPTAGDPAFPDVFVKTPNVLAAPRDPVMLPPESGDVDYEGEIAVVIGRRARGVALADAPDHIAGYTLFNDVSARDWQSRSSQWELGKCFDGFGPLGPQLVTPDEIGDPQRLLLEVRRDGVTTVSQDTSTMIFPMAFVVHYLSGAMTLLPGDVIATGSPQKLPEALAAHRPLAPGDSVTISVDGIGELTTTFIAPQEVSE